MVKVDPQFNTGSAENRTQQGENRSQESNYSSQNNRSQAEDLAGKKPKQEKSKLLKYGAIGAGISLVLMMLKKKLLALVAAAATGFFIYKNVSKNPSPPQPEVQTEQKSEAVQAEINPLVKEQLEQISNYINTKKTKLKPVSQEMINEWMTELKDKLASTPDDEELKLITQVLHQISSPNNKQDLDDLKQFRKDIAAIMHPDVIKQADLGESEDLSAMIFKASREKSEKEIELENSV